MLEVRMTAPCYFRTLQAGFSLYFPVTNDHGDGLEGSHQLPDAEQNYTWLPE